MTKENDDLDLDLDMDGLEDEKPASSKGKLIIMGGALALVLVGGAGAYFMFAGSDNKSQEKIAKVDAEKNQAEQEQNKIIYIKIEPEIEASVLDEDGKKHFLRIGVAVMAADESIAELIKIHKPLVSNDLLNLISSKKYNEVESVQGKLALRKEALDVIKKVLKKHQVAGQPDKSEKVNEVLFTSFVME